MKYLLLIVFLLTHIILLGQDYTQPELQPVSFFNGNVIVHLNEGDVILQKPDTVPMGNDCQQVVYRSAFITSSDSVRITTNTVVDCEFSPGQSFSSNQDQGVYIVSETWQGFDDAKRVSSEPFKILSVNPQIIVQDTLMTVYFDSPMTDPQLWGFPKTKTGNEERENMTKLWLYTIDTELEQWNKGVHYVSTQPTKQPDVLYVHLHRNHSLDDIRKASKTISEFAMHLAEEVFTANSLRTNMELIED